MNRITQFLRTLLPNDLWQLAFLSGVIFLFITPRLSWFPLKLLESSSPAWLHSISENRAPLSMHLIVLMYPVTFASLVAYYTCFWPGNRPVRRVLLGVFLPTLVSLALITNEFFQPGTSSQSVFESPRGFGVFPKWVIASAGKFPTGLYFCVLAVLLLAVFTVRMRFGASTLPLTLYRQRDSSIQPDELWNKFKMLVFFLVCPLFVLRIVSNALLSFPYWYWPKFSQTLASSFYGALTEVVQAALLVLVSALILGAASRKAIRASAKLPEPGSALFALILPVGISFLISSLAYAIERAYWAGHEFGIFAPPQFDSYFATYHVWRFSLLLMVFAAFAEEIVFRGLLLRKSIEHYGFHRGILMTGMIWAAFHFHSDRHAGLSVGAVFIGIVSRVLICVAMNHVLAWMTLRWNSIIPAGIAHTFSNMLVVSGINNPVPWSHEFRIALWITAALLLFRYWPVNIEDSQDAVPELPKSESTI